jgi:hypothetical protein
MTAEMGRDLVPGGRPLKRCLQCKVEDGSAVTFCVESKR